MEDGTHTMDGQRLGREEFSLNLEPTHKFIEFLEKRKKPLGDIPLDNLRDMFY